MGVPTNVTSKGGFRALSQHHAEDCRRRTKPGARGVGGEAEAGGHRGHGCPPCQGSPGVLRMEEEAAGAAFTKEGFTGSGRLRQNAKPLAVRPEPETRAWNSRGAKFKVLAPGIEPGGWLGPEAGACAQVRAGERARVLGFCAPSSSAGLSHACTYVQRDAHTCSRTHWEAAQGQDDQWISLPAFLGAFTAWEGPGERVRVRGHTARAGPKKIL